MAEPLSLPEFPPDGPWFSIRSVCYMDSNDFESLVSYLTFSKSNQQVSSSYGVGVQAVEILAS